MSVRQYVGARYVPKFFSNNGSSEWLPNTDYEALTIVTYNNSSYTSKVHVPATIGNPADNKEYWAITGNYNAQVEEYRQAVEETRKYPIYDSSNENLKFAGSVTTGSETTHRYDSNTNTMTIKT